MRRAWALCGLVCLAACGGEGRVAATGAEPSGGESGVVAATQAFNFDYQGDVYAISLVDTLEDQPGTLTVMGFDRDSPAGAPGRIPAVAEAVCRSEGRVFDPLAEVKVREDRPIWSFVKACL